MLLTDDDIRPRAEKGIFSTPSGNVPEGVVVFDKGVGKQLYQQLAKEKCTWYITEGKFASHQLISTLLELSGPSDIYLATYTISEDPARLIAQWIRIGKIKRFYAVLDHRIATYNPKAYQLLKNVATGLKLTQNHAKLLLVDNETKPYCAMMTSNINKNKRVESGVVYQNQILAGDIKCWFEEKLKTSL